MISTKEQTSLNIARIRSYSGPYFLPFGLNTDRITPNMDTFHVLIKNQEKWLRINTLDK